MTTPETSSHLPDEVREKAIDYVASGAKAIAGAAPFVGSILAELAGVVIPNQRLDRIAKFAAALEERIRNLEQADVRKSLHDEEFTDLLEGALRQAARSTSDERRGYLASLIANSLSNETIEHAESKHLLRILDELNDIEIIWLRFYLRPGMGGDEDFRGKHQAVLARRQAFIGSSEEVLDKHALQESYQDHLIDLGLVTAHISRDMRTGIPEFDRFTGEPKVSYHYISPLGKLLLRTIGIKDQELEKRQEAQQSAAPNAGSAGAPPASVS
jgi:hypothetical protein